MRSQSRAQSSLRSAVVAGGLSIALTIAMAGTAAAQTTQSSSQASALGVGSISDLISRITGGSRSDAAPAPKPSARVTPSAKPGARARLRTNKTAGVTRDPRTRFVVALDKRVPFQVFALTEPNRVIVDMPKVRMRLPRQPRRTVGLIKSFRGGLAGSSRARIVINVSEPVVIDRAVIQPNIRSGRDELVVDILPARVKATRDAHRARYRKTAMSLGLGGTKRGLQPPVPRAAQAPAQLKARRFKPLIVIDPGHGGKDSGAKKHGTVEKDVVLKFGLALRKKLLSTGRYRVKMTRSDDRFIPLGARRAFAERHKAALFIAVHADYARSGARGATIYSLRQRVATKLRRSARSSVTRTVLSKGDAAKIRKARGSVSTVKKILGDLAARDVDATQRKTHLFTKSVIRTMSKSTNMRRKPDRKAAFKVLRTAKVPSVLVELAFVTNKRDAAQLRSKTWRDRVSGSIANAVDNYFSHSITRLPL